MIEIAIFDKFKNLSIFDSLIDDGIISLKVYPVPNSESPIINEIYETNVKLFHNGDIQKAYELIKNLNLTVITDKISQKYSYDVEKIEIDSNGREIKKKEKIVKEIYTTDRIICKLVR